MKGPDVESSADIIQIRLKQQLCASSFKNSRLASKGLVHVLKDVHTSEQGPGGSHLLLTKSTKEIFLVSWCSPFTLKKSFTREGTKSSFSRI
jgi:hypothetical protein